jgi:DNA-binding phage protein
MAKFSQGFMDVLSRTGTPQAAMQQGQQGSSDYGSLQRNLGAAFGMDQRSKPEMASAEIDKIDPNSKDALIQSLAVQAKYEQDPQKKIVYMLEIDKINKDKQEKSTAINAVTTYLRRIGKPDQAKLVEAGDPKAYDEAIKQFMNPAAEDAAKFIAVAGGLYDPNTKTWVVTPKTEIDSYEVTNIDGTTSRHFYEKGNPTNVVKVVNTGTKAGRNNLLNYITTAGDGSQTQHYFYEADPSKIINSVPLGTSPTAIKTNLQIAQLNAANEQKTKTRAEIEANRDLLAELLDTSRAPKKLVEIARKGGVTFEDVEPWLSSDVSPESWTMGAQVMFTDEEQNLFMGTLQSSKAGVIKSVIVPLTAGVKQVGKLTIVNSSTGETSERRQERDVKTADDKNWLEDRAAHLNSALKASDSLGGVNRLIDLLDTVSTSGFTSSVVKPFEDFLGTTPSNVGEFNNLAADFVLQKLSMLGANPTEGERNYIIESAAALRQSGASNSAILKNMSATLNKIVKRGTWLLANPQASRDEFTSFSIESAQKKTVNFRDLK